MARLRRFLHLEPEEQLLFLRALCLMAAVRTALLFVPIQRVNSRLETVMNKAPRQPLTAERAAKRLEQAARFCPLNITCLVKALVSRALLMQYGYPADICIGVLKSGLELEAHAWLRSAGTVVIGDPAPAGKQFVPILGAERLVE
jgi:hypothetical protein